MWLHVGYHIVAHKKWPYILYPAFLLTYLTTNIHNWGRAPRQRHWHLSPRKAPQSKTKQVSWLAALTYSLHQSPARCQDESQTATNVVDNL